MVDDDFEEGEIEGLVNDTLEPKVCSCTAIQEVYSETTGGAKCGARTFAVVQVELRQGDVSQVLSSKKQLKKHKKKEQENGSGKAYFDVYGQQVSTYTSES